MNVRSVPTSIREHRVRTAGIATLTFLIVTFPVWLAQVWPLFTDRVFIDVMHEKGWGAVVVGPLYGWFCVVLGVGLVALTATDLLSSPPAASVPRFNEEKAVALLQDYYLRGVALRGRILHKGATAEEIKAFKPELDQLRDGIVNDTHGLLPPATAHKFTPPAFYKLPANPLPGHEDLDHQEERRTILAIVDSFLTQVHREWARLTGSHGSDAHPTPTLPDRMPMSPRGDENRVGRTDWLKLADDFQRISDSTVRADWGKTSAGEQWHVSGGTLPATRDCAALCRLAGAMLIASPKVSASLASSLRNVKDHTDRWLYYLKETSRTFEFDLEGEEVIDGRHSTVIGGSIDRLADESRRACLACAAEEL